MVSVAEARLPDTGATRALVGLLQVLLCGEQSAGLAFDLLERRRTRAGDPEPMRAQLRAIAADERHHERLLAGLLNTMPQGPPATAARLGAERFFSGLASRDVGIHFTRIAALDSAVCLLLSTLRKAQPRLFLPALARIAADEADHVAAAGSYARRLTTAARRAATAAETRLGLIQLLVLQADSLELLGMDPARTFARLAVPPRFLLA